MTMTWWKVYLRGKLIDEVPYDSDCDEDYVRRGLIGHDGYDSGIVVKKARKSSSKPKRRAGGKARHAGSGRLERSLLRPFATYCAGCHAHLGGKEHAWRVKGTEQYLCNACGGGAGGGKKRHGAVKRGSGWRRTHKRAVWTRESRGYKLIVKADRRYGDFQWEVRKTDGQLVRQGGKTTRAKAQAEAMREVALTLKYGLPKDQPLGKQVAELKALLK